MGGEVVIGLSFEATAPERTQEEAFAKLLAMEPVLEAFLGMQGYGRVEIKGELARWRRPDEPTPGH